MGSEPNLSLTAFILHAEDPAHYARQPLPVRGILRKLLPARIGNRIKLGLAIVLRRAPCGIDPPTLLQPYQRRIDRPLIQQDFIPAYLLNPPRNAVSVQRTHRRQ